MLIQRTFEPHLLRVYPTWLGFKMSPNLVRDPDQSLVPGSRVAKGFPTSCSNDFRSWLEGVDLFKA